MANPSTIAKKSEGGKTIQEKAGFTHQYKITSADLQDSTDNTAQVINLFTLKAGQRITDILFKVVTPFTEIDASSNPVASLTFALGETGDADGFSAAVSVLDDQSPVTYGPAAYQASSGDLNTVNDADTTIIATVTPDSGGAVDEVKDGEIIVLFRVDTIDDAIESALKL